MKYIDIHSHLGFEDYGDDRKEVIRRMQEAGVGTIAIGADLETSKEAVKVAMENENIWSCIGMHPAHDTDILEVKTPYGVTTEVNHGSLEFDEKEFEELIKNPKVVAVGECGLEYYKLEGDIEKIKAKQKEIFIKQINLAVKYNKPLMLHLRDAEKYKGLAFEGQAFVSAFEEAYEILKEYKGQVRGNVHFFTGKLEMAQKFIDLGFTISFVGLITYIQDFDKIIKNVPLESLQAETDAPYVPPVPHRGERNEPSYVIEVYKKIALIRGEDPELVRLQLLENAKRVFGI
jgi:TatD DNase family protein